MEQLRLNELLSDPGSISSSDIAPLEALVEKHPYFHSARLLLIKGLYAEGSVYFDEAARTCAAHVPDRQVIYEMTVQKELRQKVKEVEAELNEEVSESIEEKQIDPTAERDLQTLEELIVSEALEGTFNLEDHEILETELDDRENVIIEEPPQERSFLEWITGEQEPQRKKSATKTEIIDDFLAKTPLEEKKVPFFSAVDMGRLSLVEDMSFVTETLARIYWEQGHFDKASKAYRQLQLKEPQKSAYFAARLKELEEKRTKK